MHWTGRWGWSYYIARHEAPKPSGGLIYTHPLHPGLRFVSGAFASYAAEVSTQTPSLCLTSSRAVKLRGVSTFSFRVQSSASSALSLLVFLFPTLRLSFGVESCGGKERMTAMEVGARGCAAGRENGAVAWDLWSWFKAWRSSCGCSRRRGARTGGTLPHSRSWAPGRITRLLSR